MGHLTLPPQVQEEMRKMKQAEMAEARKFMLPKEKERMRERNEAMLRDRYKSDAVVAEREEEMWEEYRQIKERVDRRKPLIESETRRQERMQLATYYLLLATCLLVITACHLVLTAHCSHHSLLASHYCHFVLTAHHSLLTTRYLLLTTCYSLLTTRYSLLRYQERMMKETQEILENPQTTEEQRNYAIRKMVHDPFKDLDAHLNPDEMAELDDLKHKGENDPEAQEKIQRLLLEATQRRIEAKIDELLDKENDVLI